MAPFGRCVAVSEFQFGLAMVAILLTFLLARLRQARAEKAILSRWKSTESVTFQDMNSRIAELAPSLREGVMVSTSPTSMDLAHGARGDIWSSPSGQRVYMN